MLVVKPGGTPSLFVVGMDPFLQAALGITRFERFQKGLPELPGDAENKAVVWISVDGKIGPVAFVGEPGIRGKAFVVQSPVQDADANPELPVLALFLKIRVRAGMRP